MLGEIIGGTIAGLGAYAGGRSAGNGAYAGGRAVAYAIDSASEEIAASNYARAEAENNIAESVEHLNGTFSDQFNSREKRLVSISLVNEDEEPIKFSTYFNQPPLFKENLNRSFRRDSEQERFKKESSSDRRKREEETRKSIENEENIKLALDTLRDCVKYRAGMDWTDFSSSYSEFMPEDVYDDIFQNTRMSEYDELYKSWLPAEENVYHRGYNILYTEFANGGIDLIKKACLKSIAEAKKYGSNQIKFGNQYHANIRMVEFEIENWNPSEKQMEIYKKIDDLVNQNRQELLERLLSDQERLIIKAVRDFAKPGVTFKCDECDSNGKFAAFTLTNENNEEAYLMIREAPNVNVSSKDGF